MYWSIDLVENGDFVKVVCGGLFTVSDCLQMLDDLLSSPFWYPDMKLMVDYRETVFKNIGIDDLLLIRDFHVRNDERFGRSKIAVLMTPRDWFYSGRQYEILSEAKVSSEMLIISRETDAMLWLHSLPGGRYIN